SGATGLSLVGICVGRSRARSSRNDGETDIPPVPGLTSPSASGWISGLPGPPGVRTPSVVLLEPSIGLPPSSFMMRKILGMGCRVRQSRRRVGTARGITVIIVAGYPTDRRACRRCVLTALLCPLEADDVASCGRCPGQPEVPAQRGAGAAGVLLLGSRAALLDGRADGAAPGGAAPAAARGAHERLSERPHGARRRLPGPLRPRRGDAGGGRAAATVGEPRRFR